MNSSGAYHYQYNLSDHLGDNRLLFDSYSGTAAMLQQDDYMPFGYEISRTTPANPKNEYLYNKKELQEDLQLYDYGARLYDPVTGRWTSVDPMAEQMRRFTPYNYVWDDPMRFTDPDGMAPDGPGDDDGLDAARVGIAIGGALKSIELSAKTLLYNAGDALGITPARSGMKWEATQVQGSDGTYHDQMVQVPRGTLLQDIGGHTLDGLNVAAGVSSVTKGTTGTMFAKSEPEAATTANATQVVKRTLTEPVLPAKTIAKRNGVEVVHYTKSGDHGPPHLHVNGGGNATKIGQAGKPLKGSPELSSTQQDVVKEFKTEIRSAVKKIGKWFNYQSQQK